MKTEDVHAGVTVNNEDHHLINDHDHDLCMHAVTSSIMQLSFIKFHLAPQNFKLSCVQLMISSGSPLNVLHFSSKNSSRRI